MRVGGLHKKKKKKKKDILWKKLKVKSQQEAWGLKVVIFKTKKGTIEKGFLGEKGGVCVS